jgi:hypothetical protein
MDDLAFRPASTNSPRTNLPVALTRFVGREREPYHPPEGEKNRPFGWFVLSFITRDTM